MPTGLVTHARLHRSTSEPELDKAWNAVLLPPRGTVGQTRTPLDVWKLGVFLGSYDLWFAPSGFEAPARPTISLTTGGELTTRAGALQVTLPLYAEPPGVVGTITINAMTWYSWDTLSTNVPTLGEQYQPSQSRPLMSPVPADDDPLTNRPALEIRGGFAAERRDPHLRALDWVQETTGLPVERIARLIGVTRQTIHAWKRGEPISDANRRNLLAVYDILSRAAKNCRQREELLAWLDTPHSAEAQTPAQLMERGEYDRARYLSMVARTAALRPLPEWAQANVPIRFRLGAQVRRKALPPGEDQDDPPLESPDLSNRDE